MNALKALIRKDLILYFSNRRALIMNIAAPIVIAAFFGSLFGNADNKPTKIPVVVSNLDTSEVSTKIVTALLADTTLAVETKTETEGMELVRKGKVRAVVVIPAAFGDNATRALFQPDKKPTIAIHYDPSQAMVLALLRGMLTQHVMKIVSEAAFSGLTGSNGFNVISDAQKSVAESTTLTPARKRDYLSMFDSIKKVQTPQTPTTATNDAATPNSSGPRLDIPFSTTESEVTSGNDIKYNSYAHSFAGMSVQFILFMGIEMGVGLLLMRRMGLWKRLRAAPISRSLLLGSRVASGALIAVILTAIIYAVAMAVFKVRIEGSLIGFIGVVISFAILTASFGMLIAAIGKTPEATRGLAIFVTLIMVMLGGAWIPSFIFPEWLQSASLAMPTRWAVDGFDAMTWRGLGLDAAIAPIGVMLAFSAVFGLIAMWKFDWEE